MHALGRTMNKLGLIAGGGRLPVELARFCQRVGRPVFVARLKGFSGGGLESFDGADFGIGELGKLIEAFRRSGVTSVCMAGVVTRPDFRTLVPDFRGLAAMPGLIAAASKGDDSLLRQLVGVFEKEGFRVEGASDIMNELLLQAGPLGQVRPTVEQMNDAARALDVALAVGRLDVGQGAVVCDGLVLAVEAQEGTDAMLRRVAELAPEIRGSRTSPRGVLAKAPKPIQERRVDLPTIGVGTVEAVARAGLAGIAGVSGGLIVLERAAVTAAADRLGVFIWGASERGPDPQ